ncbi:PLxRFG domain-containing protein [Acinetobacter modestus]|uniref:PLxRFG domain-containing protein n=1 Tax=Acinetobacter modestus TaxID=1776740 RepID=UPI003015A865
MNPSQKFNEFVESAAKDGQKKSSDVINERGRIFREVITPQLVKLGANDTDMVNAQKRWYQSTDKVMENYNFLPKDGQSMRSAEKNLRADRAVNESLRTGSKLPLIKETLLSTKDTFANAFGSGANTMISSGARFANDIGDNEKGTVSDRIANFADSNAKAFGKAASSQQKAIEAGEMGKTAQLGVGGVQSLPAIAAPFGIAGLATRTAGLAVGAGRTAATFGAGAGLVAGHTQNYGEVRRGATDNLKRDFPSWDSLQNNPEFQTKLNENYNSGMSLDAARQQAYEDTIDKISEHEADVYGTAMTALDVVAPDGALLGSGILKHLPDSKLTKYLVGGTDPALVRQQLNRSERVGLAKLVPDVSLAANKAALGMVAKQGLQEGAQGAVGEYGSQAASADIGGKPVEWKKVGQSFVDEGIMGGIMGAGMQSASGHTPVGQAKAIAEQIKSQTSSVIQDEARARQSLSQAMEFGNPVAIQEAELDLELVKQRAGKLKETYQEHGLEFPSHIDGIINPAQATQQVQQATPAVIPDREQQQQANAERLANQQQFEQVYGKGTPNPTIDIASIDPAVIDQSRLPEIEASQPVKPSISSIVNKHVDGAVNQLQTEAETLGLTDFGHSPNQVVSTAENDPNLNSFDNEPLSNTAQSIKHGMSEISKGMDEGAREQVAQYIREGKTDRLTYRKDDAIQAALNNPNYKVQHNEDGSVTVVGVKTADNIWHGENNAENSNTTTSNTQFEGSPQELSNPAIESGAKESTLSGSEAIAQDGENQTFADKLLNAHINEPSTKTKLINDEIAKGRPRHEVLAEVSKIIDQYNRNQKDDSDDSDGSITKPNSPQPNTPPVPENGVDENIDKNGELESQYQGMEYGDIGRKSDGMPFANKNAAKNYQKKYSLENTHDIKQIGKGTKFILRPKSQLPLSEQIANDGVFAPYNEIARQYGRSVTTGGVILNNQGKDTGVRIVEKRNGMRIESSNGKLLFSAKNPNALELFIYDHWGDVKLDEGELEKAQPKPATEQPQDIEKTPAQAPKTIGTGDNAKTYIGDNQHGQSLYADKNGVRSILEDGILNTEAVSVTPKGIERNAREDRYKTVDEQTPKVTSTDTQEESQQGYDFGSKTKRQKEADLQRALKKALVQIKNAHENVEADVANGFVQFKQGKAKYKVVVVTIDSDSETIDFKGDQVRVSSISFRDIAEQGLNSPISLRINHIFDEYVESNPLAQVNENPTEKQTETTNNQQVNEGNANERLANDAANTPRKDEVSERGRVTQQRIEQENNPDLGAEQPRNGETPEKTSHSERSSVRGSRENVENEPAVSESRDASDGREGTSRERALDAGRGSIDPELNSDSAVKVNAQDFSLDNPLDIIGGTPVQRFDKNRKALELLDELESEGRQATAEEQKILAGYIGFGSFGQDLFQGTWDKPIYRDQKAWENRSKWLRERLGEKAWKSAQRSITNAHYTDPHTVAAMWDMLRRMGVDGGRILEPAVGTGNFFSLMPSDIKQNSQLTGIELDVTTGAIAKQLFPNSNIQIMGYQDSKTPDNFYDVVVSNFPFENTPIADRKYNKFNPMLHDYFFLKAVDQVRAGGLVMSITSAGTMDKQGLTIRRELAKSAELVAAFRLPSGAFKEYAGTDVVTDIIILRKRHEKLATVPADSGWINIQEVSTPSGTPVKVNEYYANNPQHILGTLDYGHGTTTFKAGMIVKRPENMLERLKEAVKLVPEGALQPKAVQDHLTYFANKTGERHGALSVIDGDLMIAVGDQLVKANEHTKYELKDSKKTAQREQGLKDVIGLRQLYSDLVDAERSGNIATKERKALNKAYQDYTKSHGALRDSFALSYLERIDDPFFASIAALENDDGTPATILTKSTTRGKSDIAQPTISDAYIIARNQSITPNIEQISKIANKPIDEVRKELISKGAVFETPNGDVSPTDLYLSGNVREKLREAQAALDAGNTAMQKNVDALKEVMPVDVPYFNIETKMGAAWIPAAEYQNYIAHMLNLETANGIEVRFKSGRWSVTLDKNFRYLTEAKSNFGSPHITFDRLVQAAMSNQTLRLNSTDEKGNKVYDAQRSEEANASVAKIRDEFGTWLWSDAERKVQMEREYNEAMNAWATPKYDGSFMTMEGMALQIGDNAFNLRQHQQDAIWRAIANRRSMNAHEVGTGKTFTMGGIAVESRRYGIAKKPLLLAHNANSASVAAEIRMMYPSARVLYISELSPKVRALRLRQIANDDWDVVVMPHSMIDRLTLSEDTLMAMAADDIAALEEEFYTAAQEDGANTSKVDLDDEDTFKHIRSVTAKELAKARKTIIENIKKQAQLSSREDAVPFESLGVDMVLVDEVQEFKKPPIVTRMRMKGLNTQTSQRSIALQFLTRYIRSNNNGGNVHTFTGTYITNTITEIFHQMKYVMEEEMKKTNVADWDGWFGSFASELQDVELNAAGEYEMVTRLAGFVNVPELRRMVGQFMDTVFAEDMPEMKPRKTKTGKVLTDPSLTEAERVELLNGRTEGAADRPYKKVINESAEMTNAQKQIFDRLQQLAKEWRNAEPKQRREWMNKGDDHSPIIVEGKANKASLDVRLNDESLAGMEGQTKDDPNSKASRVVKNVVEIYNSHPHANQVIFTDNGFNTSVQRTARSADGEKSKYTVKVFSTVNDIVARLTQQGIPRNQIAVVTGTTSKEKRREIANAMNKSIIRVVIGSTDTLGVGVNMQRNLRAMHHLDAPYMPGDLEQRNGRGLRQANQWNTVLEYRYMTDRLDGRRWQILAVKQRFINAFMKANSNVRVIEGEAAADEQSDILESFSEAAGDPRILQRVKLSKKLESLQRKERLHTKGIADIKRNIRSEEKYKEELQGEIQEIRDSKLLENIYDLLKSQQDNFVMEVNGKTYTSRKDAVEAIEEYADKNVRLGTERHKFATYAGHPVYVEMNSFADSPLYTIWAFGKDFDGLTIRIAENRMRNVAKSFNTKVDALNHTQQTIENLKGAAEQPFGQATDLKQVEKQLSDLELDLEHNPVPPPAWLRQGAPIDSEIFHKGESLIVMGHRYADDYFVIAEDKQGMKLIPYLEVTDQSGMPIYEQHDFISPELIKKDSSDKPQNSRKDPQSSQSVGLSAKQVRSDLVSRYGEKTISELESKGVLQIVDTTPSHIKETGIEGYYANGKAVLIAENLSSNTVIPTFLHEIGGHAGLQGVMKPETYQNLMDSFNRMIDAGNPIAIEAKRRAEAETDAKTQQLEYLPYLLTVASRESLGNAKQQSAISRFISRIKSAIKAFIVDRFNVNLDLTPDDVVALAERMIQKVANSQPKVNTETRFSEKEKSVFTDALTIDPSELDRISKEIDRLAGSLQSYPKPVQMKMPPVLLALNGVNGLNIQDLPLELDRFTLRKMTGNVDGKKDTSHQLTLDQIKQLPIELADPVAVLASDDGRNLTVITTLQDPNGNPVVSAIHLNKSKGKYVINELATTFGKERFNTWINKRHDKFIYVNNGKSPANSTLPHFLEQSENAHVGVVDSKASVKSVLTPDDVVKSFENTDKPLFSRSDTTNPEDQPRSRQKEILDAVGKSAFGQLALLNAERAKTVSKRTGSFFNTMLHKALQNGEFKKTFDLVQNKINHVTYASSASMDVAPDILTQLETMDDYKKEVKNVGQKVAHTLTAGKVSRPQNEIDLEKVGELLFTNTLSDDPKIYKVSELRDLGFTDSQIELYRQAREAIDTSLNEFAKTTVSNIFKHFGGTTDEILELTAKNLRHIDHVLAIKSRMNRIAAKEPDRAEAAAVAEKHIDEVLDKLSQLKKQGYMPLMRFGKYFMRVIDPSTKEVAYRQHFESEAERNMFVRNFNVPEGYTVESSQTNELEHTLFQGVSPETLALFAKESGLPTDSMREAFIKHAVRDNHALKRLLRRKGIQGFNEDTKRVIAAFVLSNSRYAANQLFNPAIDESIISIKDPAYAEDAIRLRDYALDPKEEISGIKNFAFVWYMGASFMFGVVNLTQPLLQTLPYLMQYSKDWSVTSKAILQAGKSWYGKEIPAKYRVNYERARKEGHLDPQNTWMLQGLERGKSGLGASTWQLISHASGFFAQASETVNRRAALFASLDVAEQLGTEKLNKFGFKDAYDFAIRTIQETQGIYNKGNRPRASRGNVGSLLMMYKQFMISYVEQMVRMQRAGRFGGEDDEFKRRMAKLFGFGISRSLLVALGVLWSFAGATGLPFVRDLLDVVETTGGMVGKPFNTEREIQIALHGALGDALGESATTLLLDGAVNLNPVLDVKGRMGMGDLIPATAYFSPLTSEYQKSKELTGLGGAVGGLFQKVGDAMDFAKIGDYSQAAMQLAPKSVTSAGQGVIAATTGDYRNMQTGVKTNDATILDGIIKTLDAQPAQIAKEGRIRGLEMKDKAAVQYNNKRAKEEYEEALATGDVNEVNKVKQKIKDHNADNPRYPITLNLKTTETNYKKSNMSWQEKRKDAKGLAWMDSYNPYLDTAN